MMASLQGDRLRVGWILIFLACLGIGFGNECSAVLLQNSKAAADAAVLSGKVERRPNLVLIMADDVGWEAFGCYGGEDYQTPNLDQMASRGLKFSHCYSTPICTTSRVQIMTGKYNFRNYTHFGFLDPKQRTFAHMLKEAGYSTAIAGKWQLNGLYNKLPGSKDASRPKQAGFDEYLLWQLTTTNGGDPRGGERYWSPPLEHNGKFLTKEMNAGKYGPDLFCNFICDFIERKKDQPFFVYYPMVLVHSPFVATPDSIEQTDLGPVANKPPRDAASRKRNFAAMIHYMDKIVGRIVHKIEEVGQLENTLILFTADNGTHTSITSQWNGQSIRGGKAGMKDMGTHVPLIAYWKHRTPVGKVSHDLVDFTDFHATFQELAGATPDPNQHLDGSSFFPQLCGRPGMPRQWVFCHYEPYWNKTSGQFVRNQKFKLYRDGRMFEVPVDLDERHDLTQSTALDETLKSQLEVERRQLMAVMRRAPPAPQGGANGKPAGRNTRDRPTYPKWRSLDRD